MPNLLGLSFAGAMAPSFDLSQTGHPDGWGIGYYPAGGPAGAVLKEPTSPAHSMRSEMLRLWEHLLSPIFLLHVRKATWGGPADANTQPFQRSHGRRDWLFAHSGSLQHRIDLGPAPRFEPVGATDSEEILCFLLNQLAAAGLSSLSEADPALLQGWFAQVNRHGTLSVALTDGLDLCVYADSNRDPELYLWQVVPPYDPLVFGDDEVQVDLSRRRGVVGHNGVIVCTADVVPADKVAGRRIPPGHMVLIRQGTVRAEAGPAAGQDLVAAPSSGGRLSLPKAPQQRKRLSVRHVTSYRYERPVERSAHLLRLRPIDDRLQRLLSHEVHISVDGQQHEFEDVFGNHVRRMLLDQPFTELRIESQSQVEMLDVAPFLPRPPRVRSTIPLIWMPRQRQMLQPYLLPPELPDSEMEELVTYAMSFAERNDHDLLATLLDINATFHREYRYQPGVTTVFTTPFQVYRERRGVCQDFTNLFICLGRLIGVPARYVCGYFYTGPRTTGSAPEASHAWVQAYLPDLGWRGFDPTNGIITQTDHVRVAVGRMFSDATPTSGTIYVGGGRETLEVQVFVDSLP
jgi:transglutaminase-like putative cysteine protease/predicted glutamine amidotransferase